MPDRMDPENRIASLRRRPERCLYCEEPPASPEHPVPQAVGGRLTASILCVKHNNEASKADKAFCDWFAPVTHLLMIPRQDGKIGTSYATTSVDGRAVIVTADGRIEERNRIKEYDEQGRIKRAEGDLKWLERLRQQSEAFATPMPVIALPGIPSACDIKLGITEQAWPGLVKIAVHFVAGFVDDVPLSDELRRIILRNETPPDGEYLRSLPWDPELFGPEQPPRHEVTAYPGAGATFVTLMLFGIFNILVKLPPAASTKAVRYRQDFDGSPPLVTQVNMASIDWEHPLGGLDSRAFYNGLHSRINAIGITYQQREHEDMCIAAARKAISRTREMPISFIDAFRAELQCYAWPPDRIADAVEQTRAMLGKRLVPWEFPFTTERGPGWTRTWKEEKAG